MKKVNVFLAEGFEEVEALTVVDYLRRAEIDVNMVSITGDIYVKGAHDIIVKADILFEEMENEADMLVLPGGMPGTLYLKEHEGLKKLLIKYYEENRYISAICAAPTVFGANGFLKDRNAVCYPGMEDGLCCKNIPDDKVVTDGNITTSKGPGTAVLFALRLISLLHGQEMESKIRKSIILD